MLSDLDTRFRQRARKSKQELFIVWTMKKYSTHQKVHFKLHWYFPFVYLLPNILTFISPDHFIPYMKWDGFFSELPGMFIALTIYKWDRALLMTSQDEFDKKYLSAINPQSLLSNSSSKNRATLFSLSLVFFIVTYVEFVYLDNIENPKKYRSVGQMKSLENITKYILTHFSTL